jgi:hypothetical protein
MMEPCVAINGLLLAEGAGKKRAAFPAAASLKRKALAQKSSLANPALGKLELFHGRKKGQKIIFTEGCDTATYFYADCIHSHSNLILEPFFLLRRLGCHFLKLLNRITSGILWS